MRIALRLIAAVFLLSLAVLVSDPRTTLRSEMTTAKKYRSP
jgi:hypothetical protein